MYWIIEALSSFVFTFFVYLLIRRRKTKKWIVSIYFLFFVIGSLTSFGILYLDDSYSYYDFLDFGMHTLSKVMRTSAIVYVALFITILLTDHFLVKRMNKPELAVVSGIRILPFVSAQYAMITLGIIFSVFCIIDNIMPQYGLWNVDNQNIQSEKYGYHIKNVTNNDYGYPLWMIDDYPLDIDSLTDKKKIMIIGDSFIWGDGCSNSNYLWWRQLQRKLLEDGYQDCVIVGVGKCGASTQDQLRFLKNTRIIENINPDLILIGYVTNDAQYRDSEGNIVPKQANPIDYFSGNVKGYVKNAFPNIVYLINQYLNERRYTINDFNEGTGFPYEQWELEIIRGKYLERYKAETIYPLGKFAESLDIPFVLVATPNIPSVQYYKERYDSVLPLFEEAGIPVYNPLEKYVSAYEEDAHYADGINIVNSHPGTATNILLADYVRDLLENEYKEYLGSQSNLKGVSSQVNDWFPHAVMPKQEGQEIQFVYPASADLKRFLYMPIKKPYIKLCFDIPVNISKIKIRGEILESESGEIYATFEDSEKGYDSQELVKLGSFDSSNNTISVDLSNITSLCIHMDIKSPYNREFSVTME